MNNPVDSSSNHDTSDIFPGGVQMNLIEELELVIDKMVDEFNKLKKENEQLWAQLETAEKQKEDLQVRIKELELRLETEEKTIEELIKRVRGNLEKRED